MGSWKKRCLWIHHQGSVHSFETRPGHRPGQVIGSRVRWADPGWPGSAQKKTVQRLINNLINNRIHKFDQQFNKGVGSTKFWSTKIKSLQAPAEANETTQDIHQGERDSDSTSEKPIPIEAEPQETTERKKDAPQVLLQEPIAEATQGAGVGESEPRKATGIVDAQSREKYW